MKDRLNILAANLQYSFSQETAHWANNWGNILSTIFYTISQILLIEVLYSNVDNIAGYSRDQMLLFMFTGQITYYLGWTIHGNLDELISAVNTGSLDSLLVRPVPALFYITFKKVRLISLFRDSLPPMVVLGSVIVWSNLNLSWLLVSTGLFIAFLGMICMHIVHLLATLPVFWLGESSSILSLSEHVEYNIGKIIPMEGYSKNFQTIFLIAIPVLVSTSLATSVMLGKSDVLGSSLLALGVTSAALIVRKYAWNKALLAYTSASS